MGKTVECELKKKKYYLFQKRILWYGLLSPYIRHAPLPFPIGLLLANIRLSSFEWSLLAGVFSWHTLKLPSPWRRVEPCRGTPGGTVIHTTQEIPSDQSITSCLCTSNHSYLISCVRVRVRKCGHSYFLRIIKAQIQSHHLPVMLFDCWDERLQNASVHILQDVSELR